jgi:hypothetical protein
LSALVAASALAVGLSGCGAGPNQAGAAAIVGDTSVPLGDTQRRIDVALAKPGLVDQVKLQGGTAADISRQVVTRSVHHLLLAEAARRESIAVRAEDIDAELADEGGLDNLVESTIYDKESVRDAVRDRLLAQGLARKLLTRVSATIDLTSATSRDDAVAKARRMAAGPAEAAAVLAADPRAKRGQVLRASLNPQLAASFLFGTPAGTVVAVQTSPAPDGWTVLRVTARSTTAAPVGGPGALAQLDGDTLDEIGRRFTQPLAAELGVRVNPRYGTWDQLLLVVQAPDAPAAVVLPAELS